MTQIPLPSGWQRVELGDLCSNGRGVVQTGPFGSQLHASDYIATGIAVVNPTHLRFNSIAVDSLPYISKQKADTLSKHYMVEGDILVSRRGDFSRYSYITSEYSGWLCGTGCLLVRLNNPRVDNNYLSFLIGTESSQKYLAQNSVGSIMPNLNTKILQSLPVVLPPVPEQKAISHTLQAIQDAKEARQQELSLERERKAALMQYLFAHGTRGETRKYTEIGDMPVSWQTVKLKEIANIQSGSTPSRARKDFYGGEINWVKTLDLNDSIVTATEEHITEEGFSSIRGRIRQLHTVMVAMYGGAGTIGKAGILGIPAATNQAVCCIEPNPQKFNASFLLYYLIHTRPIWMRHAIGTRKDPNISKGVIEKRVVPLPPLDQQKEISDIITSCNDKIAALEQEIALLEELFRAALDGFMSGKLSAKPFIQVEAMS